MCLWFLAACDILGEFVHVMLHGILFVRDIYPRAAFERRKLYGVPMQVVTLQLSSSSKCLPVAREVPVLEEKFLCVLGKLLQNEKLYRCKMQNTGT